MQSQYFLIAALLIVATIVAYDILSGRVVARTAVRKRLAYDMGPKTEVLPPSPDELAMRFAAALLAKSGDTMSAEAAITNAWWAVPHFYIGRRAYVEQIAPTVFHPLHVSEDEGERKNSEAVNDGPDAIPHFRV